MTQLGDQPGDEVQNLLLTPRDVRFDWTDLPMHWVPGDPQTTHTLNVLHLLLPEGERWFAAVFKQALPLITDDRLREDVLGFIAQEHIHAEAHQGVLDHLLERGLDCRPYTRQMEYLFRNVLGERDGLEPALQREHLVERIATVAAIEHFTAYMGHWALTNSHALDRIGADPVMLDLLRWHGAEEVEHRTVAFDLMAHLDRRYVRRVRAMAMTAPPFIWLWARGVRFLFRADPSLPHRAKPTWRAAGKAARHGLLPGPWDLFKSFMNYMRPDYHPTQECSTRKAVAYLGASKAARAAQ